MLFTGKRQRDMIIQFDVYFILSGCVLGCFLCVLFMLFFVVVVFFFSKFNRSHIVVTFINKLTSMLYNCKQNEQKFGFLLQQRLL